MDSSIPPLPAMNAATLLRALCKRPAAGPGAIPATRYALDRIDLQNVARYREALGFRGAAIPLTWFYLPAQRAHLATMLAAPVPFRLAGIIHVDNALRLGAEADPGAPLLLATRVELGGAAANGAVHAVLETAGSQGDRQVFACRSTYLVVRGRRVQAARPAAALPAPLPDLAAWELGPGSGRAYAAVSGDWNPIHLWPWSARLMGLPAPIIHGMHSMGRACAELERASGRRVGALDGRFRAPAALGSRVVLGADLDGGRYDLRLGARAVLEGLFNLM